MIAPTPDDPVAAHLDLIIAGAASSHLRPERVNDLSRVGAVWARGRVEGLDLRFGDRSHALEGGIERGKVDCSALVANDEPRERVQVDADGSEANSERLDDRRPTAHEGIKHNLASGFRELLERVGVEGGGIRLRATVEQTEQDRAEHRR